MAHTSTYIDPLVAFNTDRVSTMIGNPMLDVAHLCTDTIPYFQFGSTYYTRVNPSKCTSATTVNIYTLGQTTVDMEVYDAMTYVGTGSQNGSTLTYGGTSYTYASKIEIRCFAINKWSKCKPIRYIQLADLADSQRVGYTDDGYRYGVRCVAPYNNYKDMHNMYMYRPPTLPGEGYDYYRLTDFAGYDHNAKATTYGILQTGTKYYYHQASWLRAQIVLDQSGKNTTGINVLDLINADGSNNASYLQGCYVFCMIGGYCACMGNAQYQNTDGTYKITPIYYGSAWQQYFTINVKTLRDQHTILAGDYPMTIFLAYHTTGSAAELPITGEWVDVEGEGLIFTHNAFPLPDVTGKTINISSGSTAVKAKVTGLTATSSALVVNWGWESAAPTTTTEVKITVTLEDGIPHTTTLTYTTNSLVRLASFTWSELGVLYSPHTTVTVKSTTIQTKVSTETVWTAGTGLGSTTVTMP